MNRIHIAYHGSALGEASKLSSKLQALGWKVFTSECGKEKRGALSNALSSFTGPTLLLINDGFLHNLNCQYGMLETYKGISDREHTHPILASSMRNGPGNVQARVLTSLDRVSDVIRYMNYWQNVYLTKRRELGSTSTPESAAALAPFRKVSQEIGELLKLFRNEKPHSIYDLIEDDGILLLKLLGTPPKAEETTTSDAPTAPLETETTVEQSEESIEDAAEQTAVEEATAQNQTDVSEVTSTVTASTAAVAVSEEEKKALPPDLPPLEEGVEPNAEVSEEPEVEEPTSPTPEKKPIPTTEKDYFSAEELSEDHVVEDESTTVTSQDAEETDKSSEDPTLAELAATKHKKSRKANAKQLLALIEEDELEDAFSFAESSLSADPGNAKLRYYYAVALLQAATDEKTAIAIDELNKLLQGDYAAKAHLCLGHISLDRRDYGTARRNLEAAIKLNKKVDSELTYRLGALIQDEYYEETKKAKKYLKKATKQSQFNKGDAWYRLAQLDLQNDKPKKAKKKLKNVLAEGNRHPFAAYDLASLYLKDDNIPKANKYYLKAINANSELDTAANQAAFSLLRPVAEPDGFDSAAGEFAVPDQENDGPAVGQLTVLITGASSGIGAATARVFAENGHRLILTGRRVSNLRSLGAGLNKEFNVPIRLLSFDVTAFDQTEQLLSTLPEGWNEIDVLINNAGKAKGLDYIHQGRLEHWEEMIDTNVKGLLYMIRLVSPKMVERKQGHIINVCSTAGHEVYPKGAVYCATKHAVDAITQGARLDLHSHGIRVSQVSPAHVEETEFAAVRFDGDTDKAEKVYENFQPLRARDVAKSIYYIASQPEHVNVQDVLMLSTQQANSTTIDRSGR